MDDLQETSTQATRVIASIAPQDIPTFIREQIAERGLVPLIQDLNREVLSGDAFRKDAAEEALRRLGFL